MVGIKNPIHLAGTPRKSLISTIVSDNSASLESGQVQSSHTGSKPVKPVKPGQNQAMPTLISEIRAIRGPNSERYRGFEAAASVKPSQASLNPAGKIHAGNGRHSLYLGAS